MANMMKMRDVIHGMILISPDEMDIINTEAFQRLRNIRQLGTTYLVYPGAEHTRFGHSIGTMHVASRVINSLKQKHPDCFRTDKKEQAIHWAWTDQMLRLIALTHDLGHPPFSHAGEGLLPEGRKHEYSTREIILHIDIRNIIDRIGLKFRDGYSTDQYMISADEVVRIFKGDRIVRRDEMFLDFFMDSELDCDKMDYLLRDSHYCGVKYGSYDLERLLSAIGGAPDIEDGEEILPALHEDGLHAFEAFVLARYFMFLQVYFHRTRRILDISLKSYLKKILRNGQYPKKVQDYLSWDDNRVLQSLRFKKNRDLEEAEHLLARKFPRLVYQTGAHVDSHDSETYNKLRKLLLRNGYEPIFIEDDASKLPHNIPLMFSAGEKMITLFRDNGQSTNIMNASYVLSKINKSIHIQRMYVPREKREEALGLIGEKI